MAGLLTSCSLIVITVNLLRKWRLHSAARGYFTLSWQIQYPSNCTGILGVPRLTFLINQKCRQWPVLGNLYSICSINRQIRNSTSSLWLESYQMKRVRATSISAMEARKLYSDSLWEKEHSNWFIALFKPTNPCSFHSRSSESRYAAWRKVTELFIHTAQSTSK